MSNYKKIPNNKMPDVSSIELKNPINEQFVDLLNFNKYFEFESYYFDKHFYGATKHLYVRETVFEKLKEASKYLPMGYKLLIFDAWRPLSLQMTLYEKQYKKFSNEFPNAHEGELIQKTRELIATPSSDENNPFNHSTGGVVSLTIVNNNKKLDMGTDFDFLSPISHTKYFEGLFKNKNVRENRRLLYDLMTSVGFTNLPNEWWHYDYGNSNWAFYTKKEPIYNGIFTENDLIVKN